MVAGTKWLSDQASAERVGDARSAAHLQPDQQVHCCFPGNRRFLRSSILQRTQPWYVKFVTIVCVCVLLVLEGFLLVHFEIFNNYK